MARKALSSAARQIPLPLDPSEGPQPESALRREYQRMQISRRLTFEQVMANSALAICIRNLAEAAARRHA